MELLFSDTFHTVSKLGGVVSVHHAENDEVVQVPRAARGTRAAIQRQRWKRRPPRDPCMDRQWIDNGWIMDR